MAKKKDKTESDMYAELATQFGGELLSDQPPVAYYVDTGNFAVNYICSGRFMGGGLPGGRIIEMLGPSSGGKSLWACNFARGIQALNGTPVYLDCENALNPEFVARACHLDPKKLVRIGPTHGIDCLERVFLKVHNVMRGFRAKFPDDPLAFIYDSIAVSPSERELRETDMSEKFTEAEWKRVVGNKEQPGERAKICNKEFRKLESKLAKNNATMLVINQIRNKIGIVYGNPEVGSTASTVLEFYSCLRLRVSAHKKIENKTGRVIGVNLKVKNIKNRIHTPFMEAEGVQLFYQQGVNPLSGLVTALEQAERIEEAGRGMYKVKEPWAGGREIKFKATKSSNVVESSVLLDCPALIDAKDADEVEAYLNMFGEAIQTTQSDDIREKEIVNEEFDGVVEEVA